MRAALETAKAWARAIKRDVLAIYLAAKDPRTPWPARLLALCVVAYALSPIDLIPDFIPVLGHLDDLVILPLGILLVRHLIPPDILAEHRAAATAGQGARPVSRKGAAVIVALWAVAALALLWWLWPHVSAGLGPAG
jgi:uncharacterized membrane protein YkvA (DUF1232 family)